MIARTGNELFRQKKYRKATKKEKDILKDLKAKIRSQQLTDQELGDTKEEWLDELRYSRVLLEKMIRRGRKVHSNTRFRENEGRYFSEDEPERTTKRTTIDGMLETEEQLKDKIHYVEEFRVT